MSQRISILVALEGADEGLKRAIVSAERSLGELASTAKSAGAKAAAGMAEVKAGMSAFGEQVAKAKTQLLAFLSIGWAAGKVQEIVAVADAWNLMSARLKLATAGSHEYATAQQELFAIAQRIGVPIQETATLYGKLQQAVRMLGGEQQDALTITESISQALRLSGASATEAQASLLQFGQALAAGVLRGEEFNSVVENSPRLAKALADGLNVPIGRLRKMAEEGRLTADVVVKALMSQKDKLAAEYAQLPATVSQAFQRLSNAFAQWISKVDESTGLTKKLAEALTWLSEHLDTVMQWLKRLAEVGLAVLIYRLIPALVTAWQTAGAAAVTAASATTAAWTTANASVTAAAASVGKLRVAFAGLGSFLIGWEIGTWLSEQFEVVRKAGIFMVEVLLKAVEQLRYRWEVFAAIFTGDTIAAATRRHQARLKETNGIFAQMYLDASRGAEAAKGAMTTAATTAEEINRRLEAVRQGTQEAVGRGVEAVRTALDKLKSRLGEVDQAVAKASQAVTDATAKMAEAYQGLTGLVEANLQRQVEAIKTRYAQEQAALETSKQSEAAQIAQSTQLLTAALTEQTKLRQQATTDTLKLVDEESQARIAAARRQGQTEQERSANVRRVENAILATKRQTLTQALVEYRQHIDALNAEANRHLSEVQRIEEQKRQLSMTTEERIREIRRQGMTELEATEDRKRQIAEYQAKAREALAAGELEQARSFAEQAMDLAAQVASAQSDAAKRGEEARREAEQGASQVTELEAQSREAWLRREYEQADTLMRQADALRAELAEKSKEADAQIAQGKDGVNQAIGRIRDAQTLLNQALDAESKAHQQAAQSALASRNDIARTLAQTEAQVEQLTAKLQQGLTLTLDADTSRFSAALEDLDKALAEKQYLLTIQADLQQAQLQLAEWEQLLKAGQTLPVDADVSKAKDALDALKTYADRNSQFELKVTTEKAQAAVTNVESQIEALGRLQTESDHLVRTNATEARAEIQSLDGINTSSTHTVYVRKVEANASGGPVGVGVAGFADGGAVAFPRLSGGWVPGTGHRDTVPRTLDTGAFVLRTAAVRKYGTGALSRLANGVARFARGGAVDAGEVTTPKKNREAVEAFKTIDLGLKGMKTYLGWVQSHYAGAVAPGSTWAGMANAETQATADRRTLATLLHRQELTAHERGVLEQVKTRWRRGMAQPLVWGEDLERELIDYLAAHQGEFYRGGGMSASDSVPALLTPGEYVVNKTAVARYGAGFFAALNALALPARALAERVQGFAAGGPVAPLGSVLTRPVLSDSTPARTVRVELASGDRKVNASIDQRDETALLQLLETARASAA
jgi:tape measure domain-containing protein